MLTSKISFQCCRQHQLPVLNYKANFQPVMLVSNVGLNFYCSLWKLQHLSVKLVLRKSNPHF